jgi:hypothetical protein
MYVAALSTYAHACPLLAALVLPESLPSHATKQPLRDAVAHFKARRQSLNPLKAMGLLVRNEVGQLKGRGHWEAGCVNVGPEQGGHWETDPYDPIRSTARGKIWENSSYILY